MSESDIVRSILKYLKTVPGCFCWKEHGGMYGTAGIPDIIACIGGRFYGFEVKTDKGSPTRLQEAVIGKIRKAGGIAAVVRSAGEVEDILKNSIPGFAVCENCGKPFIRNGSRQKYCSNPECRNARNRKKAKTYYQRKKSR